MVRFCTGLLYQYMKIHVYEMMHRASLANLHVFFITLGLWMNSNKREHVAIAHVI